MKLKKLAIILVLVFVLSSCTRQTDVSSLPQHEMSRVTEQSPSSHITDILEESSNPSEASEPAEINIVELASKFAEDTGNNHPIVRRMVDDQEKYYIAYDEADTLTELSFGLLHAVERHPEISGIQIQTATGMIYFNRNGKAEIERQGEVKRYDLVSFLLGNLNELPSDSEYLSRQSIYTTDFHQDETSITFISVCIDPKAETGTTHIVRFNLDSQQIENHAYIENYIVQNSLLFDETLYILCDFGQIWDQFYAYAFSLKDLQLLEQSELLETGDGLGPRAMQLFIQDGMLCGSYLFDGEEAVVEIMAAN